MPAIGTPCTLTIWTDRVVCRVIASNKVATTIQRDKWDEQSRQWVPDPEGRVYKVTLRKNLVWKLAGQPIGTPGGFAVFGVQDYYFDHSF